MSPSTVPSVSAPSHQLIAAGVRKTNPIWLATRASLVMSIYGGTNEIQREIVAKTYGL